MRRTLLILGGMVAGAVVVFSITSYYSYPLPLELTDPDVDEEIRRAKIRELVQNTAAERRPALLRAVARQSDGEAQANIVLQSTIEFDPDSAEPVLDAYLRRFPDPHAKYVWLVKIRTRQKRFDDAIRLLREQTIAAGDDESARKVPLYPFLESMTAVGMAVEAYRATDRPDQAYAFHVLAGFLANPEDRRGPGAPHDQLRGVIAVHLESHGPTPWTYYFTGVLLQHEEKFEQAEKAYAEASRMLAEIGRGPPKLLPSAFVPTGGDRTWDESRRRRVECLYRLGRWTQAYDECEPPSHTFNDLTQRFEGQKKWDDLLRLVDRHRRRSPEDPKADLWQAVAHFGRGDYEAVIPLVDRYLQAEPHRLRQDHRAFQVKFRSQVRMDRLDDARETFAAEARFYPRLTAMMILALKSGDDRTVETLLSEHTRNRSDLADSYYADEDAGPLLRSERWAAIRARYPPRDAR